MRLVNGAADAAHDPRVINADARVVAQVVTMLTPEGSNRIIRPTFARKFSPSQLPRRGDSLEFEIQFLTNDLSPTSFDVAFELQSPAGDPISRIRETLQVAENFAHGELLGFGQLRTHAGRGADTYVASHLPIGIRCNCVIVVRRTPAVISPDFDAVIRRTHPYRHNRNSPNQSGSYHLFSLPKCRSRNIP